MKTKLINDIQNKMKPYLNDKQQNMLFKTLLGCFDNVKQVNLKNLMMIIILNIILNY